MHRSIAQVCDASFDHLVEMPARHRPRRPRLRDRGDKRALCPMLQGDSGVATPFADILGKPELMSAVWVSAAASTGIRS
jgi:hypothetical protein